VLWPKAGNARVRAGATGNAFVLSVIVTLGICSMSAFTMKKLAENLGLSVPTVSQILNNKGQLYKSQTRERVLKAARKMGYRPNAAARAVSRGKFNCLGVLSSTIPSRGHLFPNLLAGVQVGCEESDYYLTIARFPEEKLLSVQDMPKVLREWMVDGFLVLYWGKQTEILIEHVRSTGIPSLWLNHKGESNCIYPNEVDAAGQATEYLIRLGHRRIAFVNYHETGEKDAHYSFADRYLGYKCAMEKAGLAERYIKGAGFIPRNERIAFTESWLGPLDRPSAVITCFASDAMPVLHAAAGRLRLDVPRELSIITFNDRLLDDCGVAITTAQIPMYEMGYRAARMLCEKANNDSVSLPSCALSYGLLQGETCASAPD